jgi:imidazolonepropionase-like amidohydrolase
MSPAVILFSLVIENVTLIDGTGRPPREGVTLVIEGDRFLSVSSRAEAPPSTGARIDGTGKWAIPGLMDMHVHLQDIDNAKKIHAVIKGRVVVDRSALEIPANGVTEP